MESKYALCLTRRSSPIRTPELLNKPAWRRVSAYKTNGLRRSTHTLLLKWPPQASRWQYASCRKGCRESHAPRKSTYRRAGAGLNWSRLRIKSALNRQKRRSFLNHRVGGYRRANPPYHLNAVHAPCPLHVPWRGNTPLRAERAPGLWKTAIRHLRWQTKRAVGVGAWSRCGKCIEQWITLEHNPNRRQQSGPQFIRVKRIPITLSVSQLWQIGGHKIDYPAV